MNFQASGALPTIRFADAAPRHTLEATYDVQDHLVVQVPTGDYLSYLSSIEIVECDGIDTIRFTEANGGPIFDLRTEYLYLTHNRIPFELDDTGWGCLANLSASAAYQLQFAGNGHVRVRYHGRELPAPASHNNVPQAQTPPHAGTCNMWTNIYHVLTNSRYGNATTWLRDDDTGDQTEYLLCHRTGNTIRELYLVTDQPCERKWLQARWDLISRMADGTRLTFVNQGDDRTFKFALSPLDTLTATLLAVRKIDLEGVDTFAWIINDAFVTPLTFVPARG